MESIRQWINLVEAITPTLTLYHGTCTNSAASLVRNGWQPNSWSQGGNMGQRRYLYLTSGVEDAQWFANEKGCDAVVEVVNVPLAYLIHDPEDSSWDSAAEELEMARKHGLPAKLALTRPLGPEHFKIVRTGAL